VHHITHSAVQVFVIHNSFSGSLGGYTANVPAEDRSHVLKISLLDENEIILYKIYLQEH
jgi:hypothetical protein